MDTHFFDWKKAISKEEEELIPRLPSIQRDYLTLLPWVNSMLLLMLRIATIIIIIITATTTVRRKTSIPNTLVVCRWVLSAILRDSSGIVTHQIIEEKHVCPVIVIYRSDYYYFSYLVRVDRLRNWNNGQFNKRNESRKNSLPDWYSKMISSLWITLLSR